MRVREPVTERRVERVDVAERRVERGVDERAIWVAFSAHCGAVSVEELYHNHFQLSSTFFMFGFFKESAANLCTSPAKLTPDIQSTGM